MRRRRAMMLVEPLIMGAAYKAKRFHRQAKTPYQSTKAARGAAFARSIAPETA